MPKQLSQAIILYYNVYVYIRLYFIYYKKFISNFCAYKTLESLTDTLKRN